MTDHMANHAASPSAGFSGGRLAAVWVGLAVLMSSQLWDVVAAGHRRAGRASGCSTEALS
jgi:hypothetical protein